MKKIADCFALDYSMVSRIIKDSRPDTQLLTVTPYCLLVDLLLLDFA